MVPMVPMPLKTTASVEYLHNTQICSSKKWVVGPPIGAALNSISLISLKCSNGFQAICHIIYFTYCSIDITKHSTCRGGSYQLFVQPLGVLEDVAQAHGGPGPGLRRSDGGGVQDQVIPGSSLKKQGLPGQVVGPRRTENVSEQHNGIDSHRAVYTLDFIFLFQKMNCKTMLKTLGLPLRGSLEVRELPLD